MNEHKARRNPTDFARVRRKSATRSEGLLWSILRAKQLSKMKFRREHSIAHWIVDFACVSQKLVVEIDGDYHDAIEDKDLDRQHDLERLGWKVIRFTADEVEQDADAVALAITQAAGVEYEFVRRSSTGAGKFNVNAKRPKPK